MVLLLSVSVFFTVAIIALLMTSFINREEQSLDARLLQYVGEGKKISVYEAQMEESFIVRIVKPQFERVIQKVASYAPEQWKKKLAEKIYQAGNPLGLTLEQFIIFQFFLVLGLPLLTIILLSGAGLQKAIIIGLLMMFSGLILPEYIFRVQIRKKALEVQESLPDLLDLLTVSVEAGLGFDAALTRVVEKTTGHLTNEFKRLLQEIRMGKPRLEAFRELSERSITADLNTFCTAIIQADQLGVSIGKVLRVQSEQMRTKRRQRAEEAAMKAPIKMLFPLIMLIFPALFLILLGPAVIRLIMMFGGM